MPEHDSITVSSSRFGDVAIAQDRIINFRTGILGFPGLHRYALLSGTSGAACLWMQSLDDPGLAFVVANPNQFFPDYCVRLTPAQMIEYGLTEINAEEAVILVILNKGDGFPLSANLRGPIIIDLRTREAVNVVLADPRLGTREPVYG